MTDMIMDLNWEKYQTSACTRDYTSIKGEMLRCLSYCPFKDGDLIFISSPEPFSSQGELLVYPCSGVRRCCRRCRRRRQQFQTSSPLKPLGQSTPNFMLSLLRKGEQKFI